MASDRGSSPKARAVIVYNSNYGVAKTCCITPNSNGRRARGRRSIRVTPEINMSYYAKHVFFCCNQREAGEECCNDRGSQKMRDYAKDRVKQLNLSGPGKVRVNQSGCLDRCKEGPVMVIYPDAVWYTYVDRDDIDEIISEHLVHGRIVARLRI
jgi:(2Fe-2S) ferredoxin